MALLTTIDPESIEIAQRNAAADRQNQKTHEKTIAIAHQQFATDFRTWRSGRSEYHALAGGVKDELPHDEIAVLAAMAGYNAAEVSELRSVASASAILRGGSQHTCRAAKGRRRDRKTVACC